MYSRLNISFFPNIILHIKRQEVGGLNLELRNEKSKNDEISVKRTDYKEVFKAHQWFQELFAKDFPKKMNFDQTSKRKVEKGKTKATISLSLILGTKI